MGEQLLSAGRGWRRHPQPLPALSCAAVVSLCRSRLCVEDAHEGSTGDCGGGQNKKKKDSKGKDGEKEGGKKKKKKATKKKKAKSSKGEL